MHNFIFLKPINMKQFKFLFIISFFSLLACAQKNKSTVELEAPTTINYKTEIVVPDLDIPWGFVFLPDGALLITEKAGELIYSKDGTKTIIEGLPEVYVRGQGGLLDIELHPDYSKNGWLYITYASTDGEGDGGNTALIRAKLNGNKLTIGLPLLIRVPCGTSYTFSQ